MITIYGHLQRPKAASHLDGLQRAKMNTKNRGNRREKKYATELYEDNLFISPHTYKYTYIHLKINYVN